LAAEREAMDAFHLEGRMYSLLLSVVVVVVVVVVAAAVVVVVVVVDMEFCEVKRTVD